MVDSKEITIQFNSNISKDNNKIRIAFYANIGFFIEIAQMLEFNLRKLICCEKSVKEIEEKEITKENVIAICEKYDKYYSKTYEDKLMLGHLIKIVKQNKELVKEWVECLWEINNYRASLVHKIFQNNINLKLFESSDYVHTYTKERLIPMSNKTIDLNKLVIGVLNVYRDDLHKYKKRFDIPFEE